MIADEIQCGMGRTGKLFAIEHYGIVPDLVTTAKSLGAGMPISAMTGRADIMDSPHVGGVGGTYGGSPIACAAAIEAVETIRKPEFLARAVEVGRLLESGGSPGGVIGFPSWATSAAWAHELVSSSAIGSRRSRRPRRPSRPSGTRRRGGSCSFARASTATASGSCRRSSPRTRFYEEGLDVLEDAIAAQVDLMQRRGEGREAWAS